MASPGWYDQNRNRAYPFIRGTVAQPESGPLTLLNVDNGLIVDAGFTTGPKSSYEADTHVIRLHSIQRVGSKFFFTFVCDAPVLFEVPLVFTRDVTDGDYALEYADSGEVGLSAVSLSGSGSYVSKMCDEPLWSGFLVTGKMEVLVLLLPGDGIIVGGSLTCIIEPATVQNLSHSYVTQLAIGNDDRTRATGSDGCPDPVFPYPIDVIHVNDLCVVGDIAFKPGFNSYIRQGVDSITLGAAVGMGEGEPCDEITLFAGESPPEGSQLLEGGLRCNETLRSINGVGGPRFAITAGPGVLVTSVPSEHKVIIDVNLSGLAIQFDVSAVSESC